MLIDILSSASYLTVSKDAIRVFGLNTAVYCSTLLTIYKKAITKRRMFIDGTYFKIDREFITKETSLNLETQFECDSSLVEAKVIKRDTDDPSIIKFDIELFASLLAAEDIKLDKTPSKSKSKASREEIKDNKRKYEITKLKESIECNNYDVLIALRNWIDSIMSNPNKFLSVPQIEAFKSRLDEYCDGDVKKALEIINIAVIHQYVDCQWAINLLESNNFHSCNKPVSQTSALHLPEQKITTSVSDTVF